MTRWSIVVSEVNAKWQQAVAKLNFCDSLSQKFWNRLFQN